MEERTNLSESHKGSPDRENVADALSACLQQLKITWDLAVFQTFTDILRANLDPTDHADACAEMLVELFCDDAPAEEWMPEGLMPVDLVLIAELLHALARTASVEAALAVRERAARTISRILGCDCWEAALYALYEMLYFYQFIDVAQCAVRFEREVSPFFEELAKSDPLNLSDLELVLGLELCGRSETVERGIALLQQCLELRAPHFPADSATLLLPRMLLMEIRYRRGESAAAAADAKAILICPPNEDTCTHHASARVVLADMALNRIQPAKALEHLKSAEELLARFPAGEPALATLRVQIHTGLTRYHMMLSNTIDSLRQQELHARKAYELCRVHGIRDENLLAAINNLACVYGSTLQYADARRLISEAAELIREPELAYTAAATGLRNMALSLGLDSLPEPEEGCKAVDVPPQADAQTALLTHMNALWVQIYENAGAPGKGAREELDWCVRLLRDYFPGINEMSVHFARISALYWLRSGNIAEARRSILAALADSGANDTLNPQGMLFRTVLGSIIFLPSLLTGEELKKQLFVLVAGFEGRIHQLLAQQDDTVMLEGQQILHVVVNWILMLADGQTIQCSAQELYELVINAKSIYSHMIRLRKLRRLRNPQNAPLYRRIDDLQEEILARQTGHMLRSTPLDIFGLAQEKRELELTMTEQDGEEYHWILCDEILRKLPESAVFVDYYAYCSGLEQTGYLKDMRYTVFVVYRQQDAVCLRRLPTLDFLDVRQIMEMATVGLRARKNQAFGTSVATGGHALLYHKLFAAVEPMIAPSVHTLFLSPDGDLAKLPFGLLTPDLTNLLYDRFDIVYLESARELKPDISLSIAGKSALVMGNPDFTLRPLPEESVPTQMRERLVSKIPFTKVEAQLVARKTGVRPLLRSAAGKYALRDSDAAIIHIATHGTFFSDGMDDAMYEDASDALRRSLLYFAGANDWLASGSEHPTLGNGILTAVELSHLPMRSPELVVLSACFSGMGEVRVGNGIMGLQTALKAQGTQAMLLCQWEADDFASSVFMDQFYDALAAGEPAGTALTRARRYLRQVTILELSDAGWFDEQTYRSVGLVAEHMRKISRLPVNHQPFAHEKYWGGYVLYE